MTDALSPAQLTVFLKRLSRIPHGHSTGLIGDARYDVTFNVSSGGERMWLLARRLGDGDLVSFNLYRTPSGATHLKPCEMALSKVVGFVEAYRPEPSDRKPSLNGRSSKGHTS